MRENFPYSLVKTEKNLSLIQVLLVPDNISSKLELILEHKKR